MQARRHFPIPTRTLSWCSLLLSLLLLLTLNLVHGAALRLWVCGAAIPVFLWTSTLLRWRMCGNIKEAATWSFMAGFSGVIAWMIIKYIYTLR